MVKITLALLLAVIVCLPAFGQELLDTEKYKDAEVFTQKKDYDIGERLKEINAVAGKEITVFHVSGKQNRIKTSYTGVAGVATVSTFSDKQKASLITVTTRNADGSRSQYYPLTNSNGYRIYLTEKMK